MSFHPHLVGVKLEQFTGRSDFPAPDFLLTCCIPFGCTFVGEGITFSSIGNSDSLSKWGSTNMVAPKNMRDSRRGIYIFISVRVHCES